jgi:vanillate O-demethylase monooxygenase subunit
MTYTYVPPFVATLKLEYLDAGGTNVIVFAVQPQTDEHCRVFTTLLRNDVDGDAELAAAVAFEQEVLAEDLAIQAVMPLTLPLDVTAEVHTRADKLTLELRRILASIVA